MMYHMANILYRMDMEAAEQRCKRGGEDTKVFEDSRY